MGEDGNLKVIDDSESLTKDEVKHLKRIAAYWEAGRLIVVVIVALGAFGVGAVQAFDTMYKYFAR